MWLVALALGLLAYIALVERPARLAAKRAATAAPLLADLDATKVTSIEILRSNTVIRVERTNGAWRLAQLNYPAQSSVVENWLAIAAATRRRSQIAAKELLAEPGGSAAFGMDNPAATVTLLQGNKTYQFRVGKKTSAGDKLYIQDVGDDGVLVTESAIADALPGSASDWRDPTFVSFAGLKYNRAIVRSGVREFEIQRDPTNLVWRLTRPRSARANNGLIDQMLQQLQAARVSKFASDVPGNDLEPYGLQPPEVSLTLADATNQVLTLEFGKSPTNEASSVFARRSSHPSIVLVGRELTDRLRAPYTEFLDRHLIEIDPDAPGRIEIHATETFALQRQTNGGWRVVEPVDFPADPGLVAMFFKRLNTIQIADVVKEVATDPDYSASGLAPPVQQFLFKRFDSTTNTNVPLAEVDFGRAQGNRILARRPDENCIYAVRLDEMLELPQRAFELHDRRIWQFSTNQVSSLTVSISTNSWKMMRTGDGQWRLSADSQGIINPDALDEAVYWLGTLWSRAWVIPANNDLSQFAFNETRHTLTVEINAGADKSKTLSVQFGKISPTGGPFGLTTLECGPTVFEFPIEIFQRYQEAIRSLTAGVKPP